MKTKPKPNSVVGGMNMKRFSEISLKFILKEERFNIDKRSLKFNSVSFDIFSNVYRYPTK